MVSIAVLGFGVVGSGVVEVLHKNAVSIAKKASDEIRVKYILARREYPDSPFRDLVIHDFSMIETDPDVQVVVECIGGTGAALDYVRRALLAGKHVVTSNKELVAEYGYELLQIAQEKNLNFLFEASVGGGIPILRPLNSCLAANDLTEVYGILNGTTNYILTKMIREGLSFDTALRQAQEKGYAEADPTADVEGQDTCRKICILAALAFGRHVYPRQVPTEGITGIDPADIAFAGAAGCRIKLLGRALRQEDGKIVAWVSPHLLAEDQQLAGVEDVFNGIVVRGDAIGDVMFYGRGAGKLPTASAVVADVIDATRHLETKKYVAWSEGGDDVVGSFEDLPMRWYIRTAATPLQIGTSFGEVELISCGSVPAGQSAFLTGTMTKREILEKNFSVLSLIPVLD